MQIRKTLLLLIALCALSMVGCNSYPPMEKRENIQGSTEEKVAEDMMVGEMCGHDICNAYENTHSVGHHLHTHHHHKHAN